MSKEIQDVTVVLAAAGSGTRFRNSSSDPTQVSKTFVAIDGVPVWQYSVRQFRRVGCIGDILMTVSPDILDDIQEDFDQYLRNENVRLVAGGNQRWASVANALEIAGKANSNPSSHFVAIHDGARPCLTQASIETVIAKAKDRGAAILGQPIWGTVKRTDQESNITETVSRQNLFQATTPQVARLDWLTQAYSAENINLAAKQNAITDDAQLLSVAGYKVQLCIDHPSNIKITTYDDLDLASFYLRRQ